MPRLGDDHEYTPRGARERRLAGGRPKRDRKALRAGEPVVVPRRRAVKSEARRRIDRGLGGDTAGGLVSRHIAYVVRDCTRPQVAVARQMLYALERSGSLVLDSPTAAPGVVRLARVSDQFLRSPRDFVLSGDTAEEQLRRLANHLLERWAVPNWLDEAWLHDREEHWRWFVHLGAGRNLAAAPGLPFPLSKRAAHFATNAPRGLTPLQALRWGQLRGLGTPEELCREVVHSRLSTTLPDEPFWATVAQWFATYPEVFGHATVLVDYVFAQRVGDFVRPPQPTFTMRGRDPDDLLADARAWHARLARARHAPADAPRQWPASDIPGLSPKPPKASSAKEPDALPAPPDWVITELVTFADLADEGRALHHCVATYAAAAAAGRSAIFSLRRRVAGVLKPRVTIEVFPAQRRIIQARGLQNARAEGDDRKLIEHWMTQARLHAEPYVFGDADPRDWRRYARR